MTLKRQIADSVTQEKQLFMHKLIKNSCPYRLLFWTFGTTINHLLF